MRFRSFEHRHAVSILYANRQLNREIERIVAELQLSLPRPGARHDNENAHRQIQQVFERCGWGREVLVSSRTARRHYFDLVKHRVAIDIELSRRERLYRDYLRFLLAEADRRIDVGVILVFDPDARYVHPAGLRSSLPRLEDAMDDLTNLREVITVPVWVLALS